MTPRSEAIAVARVELEDLTPPTPVYLGQLGYLTLILFENLSRAVILAPNTAAKTSLSRATAEVLEAHEALITEMRGSGIDPIVAMEPFRAELDDFLRRTQGADWPETLVTCYLTGGFLTDFFTGLAAGLPAGLSQRVSLLLDIDKGQDLSDEVKWMKFSDISWAKDSKGFFYSRFPEPPKDKVLTKMEELIYQFMLVTEMQVGAGEAYSAIEGPKGELGFYCISAGGGRPWRTKIRSTSFMNLQCLEKIAKGAMVADLVAIIASLDPVMGEVDK